LNGGLAVNKSARPHFVYRTGPNFLGGFIMADVSLKFPNVNQLLTLAIAMMILFFLLKLAPESVRSLFRV